MSGYEFYESPGLTVASVVPNPYTRLNQGCMLVLPSSIHDRKKHDKILLLQNRSDEITLQTLDDLLSDSEDRLLAGAYLQERLAKGESGDKEIKIIYFPEETQFAGANGRSVRIETALISVLGFEPINDPTTALYHQGRIALSVNGIGDQTEIVTDVASLKSLYDALKTILQTPLSRVKTSLLRHTGEGSFRYLVEPSQIFSKGH